MKISCLSVAFFKLILSVGCSSQTSQSAQKERINEAVKRGDTVVIEKSDQFSELGGGAEDVKNLDKAKQFAQAFADKKTADLTITYFTVKGKKLTSRLKYDGNKISYENNNGKYIASPGKYTCDAVEIRGKSFLIEGCKGKKKTSDFSTAPVFFSNALEQP